MKEIQWLNSKTGTSKATLFLHLWITPTASLRSYLSAGEPIITLWIRMPCATSGKDGSLNFNSAMMLKQFNSPKRNTSGVRHKGHRTQLSLKDFWLWSIHLCVSVSIITPMYRCFISDWPNQEPWGGCTGTWSVKIITLITLIREQLQRVRTTGSQSLTFFFSCLIQKSSQMIRWNSKGDSCSDLHGVYTDDFTILIGGEMVVHQYAIKYNISRSFNSIQNNSQNRFDHTWT